jgi:hypothetical protein
LEIIIGLIALDLEILLVLYAYREREAIKKWIKAPYFAEDDRELKLQRRKDDIEKELAWIEANKTK